ncbi:MAG: AAA family ATPase [Burkholderiales bacterium]
MKTLCPTCQRENRDGAAFCDGCGGPVLAALAKTNGAALVSGDRSFVGRVPELARLAKSLDESMAGNGQIVMVAGDPGIGKTRIATRVAVEAKARGVLVLWGRCKEEPGAPPYWPWLQAIDAFALEHDDAALRSALGRGLGHIAGIAEEVAARFPDLPTVARASNPDQARFQLFDALTAFWKRTAGTRGLLIVLDNLHAADTASLRLLEFLASEIGSDRIMTLGTYRDIELSRHHPLSNTLAELARHAWVKKIRLGGLALGETAELVTATAGREPSRELIHAVHGQTEGNPLFLQEITRYLAQEGVIGANAPAAGGLVTIRRIPEGITEVIGTRLNRLSKTCNQVLGTAAVIGRAFRIDLVSRLTDSPGGEEEALAALEEAEAARIVEAGDEPGSYEFTHALIRETLYDELSAVRRARLHQRVATVLEGGRDPNDMRTLAAIAHHYCAALPGGDAGKALEYARMAAERADGLFAYEEAARLFRMALQASEARNGTDQVLRGELFVLLGESLTSAGEYVEARETFAQAAEAARTARSNASTTLYARAAIGFETASWRPGEPGIAAVRLLKEAHALLGTGDSVDGARVLSALSRALTLSGALVEAISASGDAIAMARRLHDPATLEIALRMGANVDFLEPFRLESSITYLEEAIRLADELGDTNHAMESITSYLTALMKRQDLTARPELFAGFERRAQVIRQPFYLYYTATSNACLAQFAGKLAESERYAEEALAIGQRQPGIDALGVFGIQMFTIRREQGRLREVAPIVKRFLATTPTSGAWRPGLALIYAELDMREDARREFDVLSANNFGALSRDALWLTSIGYLAEVCAFLEDQTGAAVLYEAMKPHTNLNLVTGATLVCVGAADRHLGMLAATMKRWDAAEEHFLAATTSNRRQGALPWVAHTQHQHARMLVARGGQGDREQARELINEASATSARLGMLRLSELLGDLRARLGEESPEAALHMELPAGLSAREAEVLRLVTIGRSNKEIARVLSLSDNTVANHVRSILAKTGTANRTEAAGFARQNGLA